MFVGTTCKTRHETEAGPSRSGWQPGFLEGKLPPYGILLRALDVNALFIGVRKSRFLQIHFTAQSIRRFPGVTRPVSSVDPPSTPARRTSDAPSLWPHLAPSRSALQTRP